MRSFKLKIISKENISKKPFDIFLLIAAILFLISFLTIGKKTDINLRDTYFVFPLIYCYWVLAIIFIAIWSLYKLIQPYLLNKFLIWFHLITSIICLVAFALIVFFYKPLDGYKLVRLSDVNNFLGMHQINFIIAVFTVAIFLFGQFSFIINMLVGLLNTMFLKIKRNNTDSGIYNL